MIVELRTLRMCNVEKINSDSTMHILGNIIEAVRVIRVTWIVICNGVLVLYILVYCNRNRVSYKYFFFFLWMNDDDFGSSVEKSIRN